MLCITKRIKDFFLHDECAVAKWDSLIQQIIAKIYFSDELTNVDVLHGLAESFLTISDAFVVYGFVLMLQSIKNKTEVKNS